MNKRGYYAAHGFEELRKTARSHGAERAEGAGGDHCRGGGQGGLRRPRRGGVLSRGGGERARGVGAPAPAPPCGAQRERDRARHRRRLGGGETALRDAHPPRAAVSRERGPGRHGGDRRGEIRSLARYALTNHKALPRQDGEPLPVVHRRRAGAGVGEEGVSARPRVCRGGEAVARDPALRPRAGGQPRRELAGAQRAACGALRKAQRARACRPRIRGGQRHPPPRRAACGRALPRRRGGDACGREVQPEHSLGGGLHHPHARRGGGDRLFDKAPLLPRAAHPQLFAAVRGRQGGRGARRRGRGGFKTHPRHGRGRGIPRRVRARALRFARQQHGGALLQHAVRRKRVLPPRAGQGVQQLRRRLGGVFL